MNDRHFDLKSELSRLDHLVPEARSQFQSSDFKSENRIRLTDLFDCQAFDIPKLHKLYTIR